MLPFVFRTKLRLLMSILLLFSATYKPVHAGIFEREPTSTDIVQLTTAILSLPTSLAAVGNPNSTWISLTEHTLKIVNDILSICDGTHERSDDFAYASAWFWYDFISIITSLCNLGQETNPDTTTSSSNDKSGDETNSSKQLTKDINYLLACAEAVIRIITALKNEIPYVWKHHGPFGEQLVFEYDYENEFHGSYIHKNRDFLLCCISFIRLSKLCCNQNDWKQKILFILLFINAYYVGCKYKERQVEWHYYKNLKDFADNLQGNLN